MQRRKRASKRKRLIAELPLGTIRDVIEEPEAGFVDSYEAEERAAIQWESMNAERQNLDDTRDRA